jgi:hypothetical protein
MDSGDVHFNNAFPAENDAYKVCYIIREKSRCWRPKKRLLVLLD